MCASVGNHLNDMYKIETIIPHFIQYLFLLSSLSFWAQNHPKFEYRTSAVPSIWHTEIISLHSYRPSAKNGFKTSKMVFHYSICILCTMTMWATLHWIKKHICKRKKPKKTFGLLFEISGFLFFWLLLRLFTMDGFFFVWSLTFYRTNFPLMSTKMIDWVKIWHTHTNSKYKCNTNRNRKLFPIKHVNRIHTDTKCIKVNIIFQSFSMNWIG